RTTVRIKQGESESKFNPVHGDGVVSTVGLQGVNPNGLQVMGFPAISISGVTGLSMVYGGAPDKDTALDETTLNFEDSLNWIHGRHSVRIGGQYLHLASKLSAVPQTVYGAFDFTGEFTGLAFADFLLGLPATSTRQAFKANRKLHQGDSAAYV